MPALPDELLRAICWQLSPTPRSLVDGPIPPEEHRHALDGVRALLALAASSRSLRTHALHEIVWRRQLLGTWLYGHAGGNEGSGESREAYFEYRRRAIKDGRVRAVVRQLASWATGSTEQIYKALDQAIGGHPEGIWEELLRWTQQKHQGAETDSFLAMANAANFCRLHAQEELAISTWQRVATRWEHDSLVNQDGSGILRQSDEEFAEFTQSLEDSYLAFSLFDTTIDAACILSLQLAMDEGMQAVLKKAPEDGADLVGVERLEFAVQLVHQVLHDEMGFCIEPAVDADMEDFSLGAVMFGFLGKALRPPKGDRDTSALTVSLRVLALLFAFVARRLPDHLSFRCLPLMPISYVTICDGAAGEAFFCSLMPWTITAPLVVTADQAKETAPFLDAPAELSLDDVRHPTGVTAMVLLGCLILSRLANDNEDDDEDEDSDLQVADRATGIAYSTLLATLPRANMIEEMMGCAARVLDTSLVAPGSSAAVMDHVLGTMDQVTRDAEWTEAWLQRKIDLMDEVAMLKQVQSSRNVRPRSLGLAEPVRKVGFVGKGGESGVTVIIGWTRSEDGKVAYLVLDGVEHRNLEEDAAAALGETHTIAPDTLAAFLESLAGTRTGSYFAGYAIEGPSTNPTGVRLIPTPRLRLEYPDDF